MSPYETVLGFWFAQTDPKAWWAADPAFDERIRGRFAALHAQAAQGELYGWRIEPRGRLAEVIVLDQFSRNLFRGSSRAFAQDLAALLLAQEAVAAGVFGCCAWRQPTTKAKARMPGKRRGCLRVIVESLRRTS